MTKVFAILFGSFLFFACNINVPQKVASSFQVMFPDASGIKWSKEGKGEYEAEFQQTGKNRSANFLEDGTWVETEREIETAEIPDVIISSIHKAYPSAVIVKVFQIDNRKGITTFEAELKTGNKTSELILDPDGTLLK